MSIPRISAIFSTYNRASLLRYSLNSLVAQSLPKNQFEVIVVDDGSTDNTRQVVEEFENILPIHYIYQTHNGLAQGKNRAVQMARAPIVLFMDDDDVANSRLLVEHLGTHEAYPDKNIAVLGFTNLRADIASSPLMHFVTQVGYYLFGYPKIRHGEMLNYTYFWGGRSSCKRDFILNYGLFDPLFRFGCEDIELGYRLSKHGLQVVYNQNAKTTMIRALNLAEFCQRIEKQGHSNWLFYQKHPVPEIESWAEVRDLEKRWRSIEKDMESFKKSAADLENLYATRKKYGIETEDSLLSLLHNAYWKIIDGMRTQGAWTTYKDQNRLSRSPDIEVIMLEKIYTERPKFHYWDNEWQDGGLSNQMLQACAKYALDVNKDGPVVIETGAGLSTLVFLASGAKEIFSIAPDYSLKNRMLEWCNKNGLPTENLNFIIDHSEIALPNIVLQKEAFADMILIDGGHGWPTVFVDFCYGNYALKKGGIIAVDDNQLYSVSEMINFLVAQDGFVFLECVDNKLAFFRKEYETRLLPDFGGQPYITSKSTFTSAPSNRTENQPPWAEIVVRESNIPGMITKEECQYYTYIGKYFSGKGEVVELGPWLGRSTSFILRGLIDNPNFSGNRLRVYDDFIWRTSWMNEYIPEKERIKNHQDFQFMFDKYIDAFRNHVIVEKRKICDYDGNHNVPQLAWNGNAIEIIYIDCGRTYEVNDAWYRIFSSSFIPGITLVIMQDWGTYRELPVKWYNQTKIFTDSKGSQLELLHELKNGDLATFIFQGSS